MGGNFPDGNPWEVNEPIDNSLIYTAFKNRFAAIIKQDFLRGILNRVDLHNAFDHCHVDFGSKCEAEVLIDVERKWERLEGLESVFKVAGLVANVLVYPLGRVHRVEVLQVGLVEQTLDFGVAQMH